MAISTAQRALRIVILALVVFVGAVGMANAQTGNRSVSWQQFDTDLAIQSDGSLVVTETQRITFSGTFQSGYRLVPLDRTSGVGDVMVAEVVGGQTLPYSRGNGQPNTYAVSIGSDGLRIDWWFPPTTNATRTFVLRYSVAGAIRIYDAGDQLQWRAIYADRDGAIAAAVVTVDLPADVSTNAVQSAWYAYSAGGSIGALAQSGVGSQTDARTIQFNLGQLTSRQGAEVRVQFPHGLIQATPPAWQAQADRADWLQQNVAPIGTFLSLLLTLGILGGGGGVLILLWLSAGRDPPVGAVPRRLESPPSDLPAPIAGTLVDEVASQREAVSALVDLGERGLVQLADEDNPRLVGSHQDVRVTLMVPLVDPRLRAYERVLLVGLFGDSPTIPAQVLLSEAKAQFASAIPFIEQQLYETVEKEGLFVRNPKSTRHRYRWMGAGLGLLGLGLAIGAALLVGSIVPIAWLPGAAVLLVGATLWWLAGAMPRRTRLGALEAAKWQAFRAQLADASRSAQPASKLPPHYLPYAVAFGVDQTFIRHLESVGNPPPRWYGGWASGPGGWVFLPGGWYGGPPMGRPDGRSSGAHGPESGAGGIAAPPAPNPQGWSDALAALLNAASEAMAHGGGGGGWSGGGFGGGGGGGGGSGGFQ